MGGAVFFEVRAGGGGIEWVGCSKPIRTPPSELLPPIPGQHSAAAAAAAAAARSIGGRGKDIPRVAAWGEAADISLLPPPDLLKVCAAEGGGGGGGVGLGPPSYFSSSSSSQGRSDRRAFICPILPLFLRKRRRHLADKKIDRKG